MTEAEIHEINVEEQMAKIREGLQRRQAQQGEAAPILTTVCHALPETIIPKLAPLHLAPCSGVSPFIPKETGYVLNDFLQYHDSEFVRSAYLGILCREPDSGSYDYYLENLRQGTMSKEEILGRLRYALEGRNKSVPVKGLFSRFCVHTFYRIPVLGYLAQLIAGVILFPKVIKDLRKLDAATGMQLSEIRYHLDDVTGDTAETLNRVIDYQSAPEELVSVKADLNEVRASLEELRSSKVDQAELQPTFEDLRFLATDRTEVQSVLEELQSSKADRSELHATMLEFHAALEELRVLARDRSDMRSLVEELRSSKVDQSEFHSTIGDMRLLAADRTVELQSAVEGLRLSKADRTEVQSAVEELRSSKVDQAVFQPSIDDLRASKADRVELAKVASQKADQDAIAGVGRELAEIQRQTRDHKNNIVDQQRRLMLLLERLKSTLPEPVDTHQLSKTIAEADQFLHAMYVSLEDEFRGTREDIKERQRAYLPYLKKLEGEREGGQVLDVGCGRGEWLELLKEEGIHAKGIDINPLLIEQCTGRGLDVIEGDALTYLRTQADSSVKAITGFHIIEHLPFEEIIKLLDEASRVLRRGGVLILETPNPQNLLVASWSFFLDPTHVRPLPSPLMKFVAEARGFCTVEILGLNPFPEYSPLSDSGSAVKLNEYFYGPRDYAVIGWKA
jgi:SAM-dependent methyltransferase